MLLRKPLQWLLTVCRAALHRLPASVRLKLRKQYRLQVLYKTALHKSQLLYGIPAKHKLADRYRVIFRQQQKTIARVNNNRSNDCKLNCLILSSDTEACLTTIRSLSIQSSVKSIFVVSNSSSECLPGADEAVRVHYVNLGADIPTNTPLLLLRSGEILRDGAISVFLHHCLSSSQVITCDTDFIVAANEFPEVECYPNWDPDLQLACGYLRTGICITDESLIDLLKHSLAENCADLAYALWLSSLAFFPSRINFTHLPLTLVHRRKEHICDWREQLQEYSSNKDWPVQINSGKSLEHAIIQWPLRKNPLVSIIIPTRNAKNLVEQCIESILNKSVYSNFEIILIDNESTEAESLEFFSLLPKLDQRIKVLKYPHAFNYSALNNFAVKYAQGELIAFINNDIEVISPEWLSMMVSHAVRPNVGCVGARLLYPSGRIQHAGVVLGYGGGAGHAHKYFPRHHTGYLNRLIASHCYSAVTAACLVIRKQLFIDVGQFNEESLKVAFNDVDLCLKVKAKGYRNIYCAEAELYHHESVSRGDDNTAEKRTRFESELLYLQAQWSCVIENDPAYNQNLTLRQENFALTETPRE